MKELWQTHRTFTIVAGAMLAVALGLVLGVALPARSAASDARTLADNLRKSVKAREGDALSAPARAALEGEVAELGRRLADMERVMNPPLVEAGTEPVVVYGNRYQALSSKLTAVSNANNIVVPEKIDISEQVEPEDVAALLPALELAQRVLAKTVEAGVARIDAIRGGRAVEEFFPSDMADAAGVTRTMVVFELKGSLDSLMKLLHLLQAKENLHVIARARFSREREDLPEATLKLAVGSVKVTEKAAEEGKKEEEFIFR